MGMEMGGGGGGVPQAQPRMPVQPVVARAVALPVGAVPVGVPQGGAFNVQPVAPVAPAAPMAPVMMPVMPARPMPVAPAAPIAPVAPVAPVAHVAAPVVVAAVPAVVVGGTILCTECGSPNDAEAENCSICATELNAARLLRDLLAMGYDEKQVKAALKRCSTVERAIQWLERKKA